MTNKEQYEYYMKTGFTPIVGSSVGNKFAQNGSFSTKDFFEPIETKLIDIESGLNIPSKPIVTKDTKIVKPIKIVKATKDLDSNKKRKTKRVIIKKKD